MTDRLTNRPSDRPTNMGDHKKVVLSITIRSLMSFTVVLSSSSNMQISSCHTNVSKRILFKETVFRVGGREGPEGQWRSPKLKFLS